MSSHQMSTGKRDKAATVIATLPPPNTGRTRITELMVAALRRQGTVTVLNLSSESAALKRGWRWRLLWRQMAAALKIALDDAGKGSIYISVNSGSAAVLDVMLMAASRWRGRQVFVHHHSFRYLDRPTLVMNAFYHIAGDRVVDVALCERMADLLKHRYRRSDIRVVPNLVDVKYRAPETVMTGSVRLGHLSNLTMAKGVGRVLDAFVTARYAGMNVELHLAGPFVDNEARLAVERAVAKWPQAVFYHGALYGGDKEAFYSSLDLFLYPTAYRVEAQPLVLLEALAAGVSIITVDRGCIDNLAKSAFDGAVQVCRLDEFAQTVRQAVARIVAQPHTRQPARNAAVRTAEAFNDNAEHASSELVQEILSTGQPKPART